MAECGIDIAGEYPKPWTDEILEAADVIITMGCLEDPSTLPGRRYEDWSLMTRTAKALQKCGPSGTKLKATCAGYSTNSKSPAGLTARTTGEG
jgi:hypothetical protein